VKKFSDGIRKLHRIYEDPDYNSDEEEDADAEDDEQNE